MYIYTYYIIYTHVPAYVCSVIDTYIYVHTALQWVSTHFERRQCITQHERSSHLFRHSGRRTSIGTTVARGPHTRKASYPRDSLRSRLLFDTAPLLARTFFFFSLFPFLPRSCSTASHVELPLAGQSEASSRSGRVSRGGWKRRILP